LIDDDTHLILSILGMEQERSPMSLISNQSQRMSHQPLSTNRIEKLDNHRTVIHVGESSSVSNDTKTVSDIINRFNTLNTKLTSTMWDGQYTFTNDLPPLLLYHVRLPADASMDSIRIQPDTQSNILRIYTEQQDSTSQLVHDSLAHRLQARTMPRICRLPKDFNYDYAHLRVIFLRDNFIRIEVPTFN
jgi:hypothetical protein